MPIVVKFARVPSWLHKGIDLHPYMDDAITRIREEIVARHDSSKGLGARVNKLRIETQPLMQTITTPLALPSTPIHENPRRTGAAFRAKNEGRFRGMAPSVVRKYIVEPLKALWAS